MDLVLINTQDLHPAIIIMCVFALSGDSAQQTATFLMIIGITVGQHTHSTEWLLLL